MAHFYKNWLQLPGTFVEKNLNFKVKTLLSLFAFRNQTQSKLHVIYFTASKLPPFIKLKQSVVQNLQFMMGRTIGLDTFEAAPTL